MYIFASEGLAGFCYDPQKLSFASVYKQTIVSVTKLELM